MNRIDLRGKALTPRDLNAVLPRAALDATAAQDVVRPIIESVRDQGAAALYDLAERFDGVRPAHLRVPQAEIDRALDELNGDIRRALEVAISATRQGHTQQLPTQREVEVVPGGRIIQRWLPVSRVGLYVPGGLAVYPSSVVMNAVCAQVAGVKSLAVASPAQSEFGGLPHPTILAACALLGVDEVWAIGGAGAIAAFAYGVVDGDDELLPVDVVTGPGNIFVAAAKRAVQGVVGIDAEAGTTEIAIIADDSANPYFVAADLISQAEHDPAAASVLITPSSDFADQVEVSLDVLVPQMKHAERIATALAGPQSGIVLVDSTQDAITVADAYGAEHLEVHTDNAAEDALKVTNAGAIFVGSYTPVPLGDYVAGSNHVLPTGGTARFASGLNVTQYLRSQQIVEYSRDALDSVRTHLQTLATAEDLPAHGEAARIRYR